MVKGEEQTLKVIDLIKTGMSAREATQEIGMPYGTYSYWSARLKKEGRHPGKVKKRKPYTKRKFKKETYETIPLAPMSDASGLIEFKGDARAMASFIKEMRTM